MDNSRKTQDPERSLGFLLQDCVRLMRRQFVARTQDMGLTLAQWQALAHLSRRSGISQATLAELLEVQPITVARLIDRMVEQGWVERRPHPTDRRAVQLYLAPSAQPMLDAMWERAVTVRDEALAGLSESDREAMIDSLLQMKRNLTTKETPSDEQAA